MTLIFKFENKWREARLLKKYVPELGDCYHIFLKDKDLIERFCLSFLIVHGEDNSFSSIGGQMFPERGLIIKSLKFAVKLYVFSAGSLPQFEDNKNKQYNMFYRKNLFA